MRQPSAIAHMGTWGLWMGIVFGAIYGAVVILLEFSLHPFYPSVPLGEILNGFVIGGVIGAIIGVPLGLVIGVILAITVRRYEMPLLAADLPHLKRIGQSTCFIMTTLTFFVIFVVMGDGFILNGGTIMIVVLPLCITFCASIWALNDYIHKLGAFVGGKRKSKRAVSS